MALTLPEENERKIQKPLQAHSNGGFSPSKLLSSSSKKRNLHIIPLKLDNLEKDDDKLGLLENQHTLISLETYH